jgi:CBS domain containing-hemolysin-like protein
MIIHLLILMVLLLLLTFNALLRAALNELSPAFLDAYESIKPERARLLIRMRSADAGSVRISLLVLDAGILLIMGATLWNLVLLADHPYFTWITALFLAIIMVPLLKTLGSAAGERFAEQLTGFTAGTLRTLSVLFLPFSAVLVRLAVLLNPPPSDTEQREEFDALVDTAREEGTLDDGEYRIFKSIMTFSEIRVADVMTPRSVMFTCNADKTVGDVAMQPELLMYSRFPVWEGDSIDGIIGYALAKDVLRWALDGRRRRPLRQLVREVYYIPDNASLEKALEQFLQRRQHLFAVVDEYGGVEGLITMEDVLETMLGAEIVDEADRVVDLRALAKSRRDKRVSDYQSRGELLEAPAEEQEEDNSEE